MAQVFTGAWSGPACAMTWGEVAGPAVVEAVSVVHFGLPITPAAAIVPVVFPRAFGFVEGPGAEALVGAGLRVVRAWWELGDGVAAGLQEVQPLVFYPALQIPWRRFAPGLVVIAPGLVSGDAVSVAYSWRYL